MFLIVFQEERKRLLAGNQKKGGKKPGGFVSKKTPKQNSNPKNAKKGQTWGKTTKEEAAALDFSNDTGLVRRADDDDELGAKEKIDLNAIESDSEDEPAPKKGGFLSFISSFTNKANHFALDTFI